MKGEGVKEYRRRGKEGEMPEGIDGKQWKKGKDERKE